MISLIVDVFLEFCLLGGIIGRVYESDLASVSIQQWEEKNLRIKQKEEETFLCGQVRLFAVYTAPVSFFFPLGTP